MTSHDTHLLSRIAPQGPTGVFYECPECGDLHRADNFVEVQFNNLVVENALPFRCDPEFQRVVDAKDDAEFRGAYSNLMIRRLGLPEWFVLLMSLEEMIWTWGYALMDLVHPSGQPLGTSEDPADEGVFWLEDAGKPRLLRPDEIWGQGLVTFHHSRELSLARVEGPHVYKLHAGVLEGTANPVTFSDRGIVAVLPPHPGTLAQMVVRELEQQAVWELAWTEREPVEQR